MTLDASGNLGVGTTSPNNKLHIKAGNGNQLRIDNAGERFTQATWVNNGTNKAALWVDNTDSLFELYGYSGMAMTFSTNGTERMRIDSSGNLLVGTTSNSTNSKFVFYSSSGRAGYIQQDDTGAWGLCVDTPNNYSDSNYLARNFRTAGFTDFYFFVGQANNVSRIQIRGDGNLLNLNNSYGGISDIKLKENIVDATPKLEKLNQVRVVNYNLIGEEQKQIGVIAQELEHIFPSMIEETKDKDEQGNDLGTTTKAVKYSVFVPMLIKAIQEQQALINDLTTRLTALENK
jgi:hypothetical protein